MATSNGLMAASLSGLNLLDYKSWRTFGPAHGLPANINAKTITTFAGHVYAGLNQQRVFRYNGQTWQPTAADLTGKEAYQLTPTTNALLVATQENILLLAADNTVQTYADALLEQPRAALQSTDGTFWLADYRRGLVRKTNNTYEAIVPAGPYSGSAFSVYSDNTAVYVLEGGYNQSYEQRSARAGFYEYTNGQWANYTGWLFTDIKQFPAIRDLTRAVRNPVNGKLYLGSYGGGLLEWSGLGNYKVFNFNNSPLISSIPDSIRYTRVPDVAADAEGNIWVVNRNQFPNRPGLHVLKPDQTWQSFAFPGFADGSNLERIALDDVGFKWMAVSRNGTSVKGLLVFDAEKNAFKHLNPANSGLPGPEIYTITKDREGAMWVGTNNGLAVFYNPAEALEADFTATLPVASGRPTLEGQVIKAIAVDGGNRKWIGTDVGIWLFNPEGDQVLAHFTAQNSPLLSDKIIDISINQKNGVVYIATEAGLVSYRGTATVTEGKPDCATVFPNPVRPEYDGLVGISGLPNNARVKITDSVGHLVYETQAAGGTVAWNTRDVKGRRVKTGVYLVFSSSADGRESCISKVAVVE
ncbi:MAG: Immunoreactive 84kD antigen PG93 [uncultured Adhaeribacter sp.]|uniref:Immunoreactive 84kD antigen PG93 n=1 Tax=uncultured Adhaeribacter sp. TaxID=448109 RepID=A0A6J4IKY1_9BACT|nr:MAG: Immunoreactive 84kD antigen PG93 [uncultured Adhaeribacter sp.]